MKFEKRGLSLLEILIAFALVTTFALAIIHMLRTSGRQTEVFSAEHFTAMFLCQKMLEDINHRVSENPHYFTELIHMASGERKTVVNGGHPLFTVLENTTNFHYLDAAEDGPITPQAGPIYRQLEPFEAQVESRFVLDPVTNHPYSNLLEIVVRVFWKDQFKNDQSYTISQMLFGVNEDHFRDTPLAPPTGFSDDQIGKALWTGLASSAMPIPPSLAAFLAANQGDAETVKGVGSLLHVIQATLLTADVINGQIEDMVRKRDTALAGNSPQTKSQAASYQEKIAGFYEQKAGLLFSLLRRFELSAESLSGRSFAETAIGSILHQKRTLLREAAVHGMGLPTRVSLNLLAAEDALTRLLEPPYRPLLAPRRINPIVRHLLDVKKLRILLDSYSGNAQASLTSLQGLLSTLRGHYAGKQPAFVQYLDGEIAITRSLATLRSHYGEATGLTASAQKIGTLPLFCENLERAVRTSSTL